MALMTDHEKIEQARTLADSGAFKRKIVDRKFEDVHFDRIMLECGHTQLMDRMWTNMTEWECRVCRNAFEPKSNITTKRALFRRWYVVFAPAILVTLWSLYMIPTLIEAWNVKEREWQEMKQRLSRIEQQLEQLKK